MFRFCLLCQLSCDGAQNLQADAAWQFWNFAEHQTAEKPLLRINLDETACRLHCDQKRGLTVCRQRALSRAKQREIVQDVSRGKLRGCFTLIAMICDDSSLQPLLPQILLGNEHIFQLRLLDALRPALASNIRVWRRPSAWANRDTMVEVVQLLAWAPGSTMQKKTCHASAGCLLHPHGPWVSARMCQTRDSGPLCASQANMASAAIGDACVRSLQSVRRLRVQAGGHAKRSL